MALAPVAGQDDPAVKWNGRIGTALQAHLLLVIACLPILGMLVIAPVLPDMQRHFSTVPNVAQLVPFALTAAALMIVIVSPLAGRVVARFGRKHTLLAALYTYLLAATAPLYLDSLFAIIASRLVVGTAEAMLITVSTMLLGDYFPPTRRDRYLAFQVVYTSIAAVLFLLIGGVLGESGWRVPFAAYGVALLVIPCVHALIWEPAGAAPEAAGGGGRLPWGSLLPVYAVTFLAGGCVTLVGIELGYVIEAVGETSSSIKGLGAAMNSVGVALGAVAIGAMEARRLSHLIMAFALTACGYAVMGLAPNVAGVVMGGALAGLGAGFYLGWLLSAVNQPLSFDNRGRGVGLWMAFYFLATVLFPGAAVATAGLLGGLQRAMLPYAGLMALLAVATPLILSSRRTAVR